MQCDNMLHSIIANFPPIEFCMAYGSGVFTQRGYKKAEEPPMIDFIFGVKDSTAWHAENLKINYGHYSSLGTIFGARAIAAVQRGFGQHIYYHPYVKVEGRAVKYGVMQLSDLEEDLAYWSTLFVSGRLHKPCALLECPDSTAQLQAINLDYALHAALLMLPSHFEPNKLWKTVAGLSYCGDPRFAVGAENPHKVSNIVDAAPERFDSWYQSALHDCQALIRMDNGSLRQLWKPADILERAPPVLRSALHGLNVDHIGLGERQRKVQLALGQIVRRAAAVQAAKGVVSAGFSKSIHYALQKRSKNKNAPMRL